MSSDDPKHAEATGFRTFPLRGPVPRLQMSALEQTIQFIRDPIPLIQRGLDECGDIFALNILGFGTWIFVCSPEGVEEQVRLPADVLVAGEVNHRFFEAFFSKDALFFMDGAQHTERKRLLLSCLKDESGYLTATVERVTRRMVDTWQVGKPFALLPDLHEISFQVILEGLFGLSVFPGSNPLVDLLRRAALEIYLSPLLAMPMLQVDLGRLSPWGRLKRLHVEMRTALDAEIQRRRQTGNLRERKDLLSQLLVYQGEHLRAFSDESLRDELLVMLAAGLDTTVFCSAWTIECALSFPDVVERIRAEIAGISSGGPLERTHISQLNYLDAVINESIRLRMPSPMTGVRRVKKSASLCGYELPPDALVSTSLAGLGLQRDLFPEPDQFRPEHFLGKKFTAFEWNPFGFGARQCVAKALGQFELRVVVATILRQTDLRLLDGDRRRERSGMFFVPKHGLRVQMERRR